MELTLEHYKQHDLEYLEEDIACEVVCDSYLPVKENGTRLTTVLVTIPQMIHQELIRHRAFSFCIASQRAIPVLKILDAANFEPVYRKKNKRGMQPGSFIEDEEVVNILSAHWNHTREEIIETVLLFEEFGVAKELTNRLIYPWQTIRVLMSGTQEAFNGFLKLRNHQDAQFEIQVLARRIENALDNSNPKSLSIGDWHIPFIREEEYDMPIEQQIIVGAARSARTSYKLPSTAADSNFDADIKLAMRLFEPPIHASPFEFVATPVPLNVVYPNYKLPNDVSYKWYKNTNGWIQIRSFLEGLKNDNLPNSVWDDVVAVRKLLNTYA